MIVKIGNFSHLVGEAGVAIDVQPLRKPNGKPFAHRHRWSIDIYVTPRASGLNQSAAIAAVNSRVAAIIKAYQSGVNLQILTPDGGSTVHSLKSSNTLSGVQLVQPPSFPEFKGVEMVTIRTIRAVFECVVTIPADQIDSYIYSHTEALSFQPSGIKRGAIETVNTPAVEQTLRRYQSFKASQKGRIVGLYDYPDAIPRPIFPSKLADSEPMVIKLHPEEMLGGIPIRWPIDYEWTFISSIPLPRNANPNIWMVDVL